MDSKRFALIVITIVMLALGFAGGYLYTLSKYTLHTLTTTVTETIYKTITSPYPITTEVSSVSIVTKPTNLSTTSISTYTYTITLLFIETMTKTISSSTQIVLRYPSIHLTKIDFNNDGIYDAVVEINPWNMKSAKGDQIMIIDVLKKSIETNISLIDVIPAEWVNGYPEIAIGRKPWYTSYANGFRVSFPMKIRNATPFVISFYICIKDLHPQMNLNIAADAWIVREAIAKSPGTAPSNGDLEIMVWLFNQNLNPAGNKVGEITIPIALNESIVNAQWEVWRMDSVSWGGWQYIAFKPKGWKHICGYVAYNPIDFVKAAAKFATFDISNHYLLGWEIGTEWGARTSNGVARLSWILKDFEVIPGASIQKQ